MVISLREQSLLTLVHGYAPTTLFSAITTAAATELEVWMMIGRTTPPYATVSIIYATEIYLSQLD